MIALYEFQRVEEAESILGSMALAA